MDGLGSYSPSQPSPVQNGSDEGIADVTKHVPESHWPLNSRQTISNWGRALTAVQREATGSVTRLLEVEGREGRVGPRRGAGLALRARKRKRKGSRLEHLAGGGACLENVGPGPQQVHGGQKSRVQFGTPESEESHSIGWIHESGIKGRGQGGR